MLLSILPSIALLAACVVAQAPQGTSVCDYYAKTLSTNQTEAQNLLIKTFVRNLFGGNSTVFSGAQVHGLLSPGTYNGTTVSLHKYFDGSLFSTNTGKADAINWLDDGGVVALVNGELSNTNSSNQFKLFEHFSGLFGKILQCSSYSALNFTSTLRYTSLYEIHKFMSLDPFELGFFIDNVGQSARSVGLTDAEANTITTRMSTGLTFRCRPPSPLFPGAPVGPQTICTDEKCPLAPDAVCAAYDFNNGTSPDPQLVNGPIPTTVLPTSTSTPSAPPTVTVTPTPIPPVSKTNSKAIGIGVGVGVGVPVALALVGIAFLIFRRQKNKMKALESRISRMEYAPSAPPDGYVKSPSQVQDYSVREDLSTAGAHGLPNGSQRETVGSFSNVPGNTGNAPLPTSPVVEQDVMPSHQAILSPVTESGDFNHHHQQDQQQQQVSPQMEQQPQTPQHYDQTHYQQYPPTSKHELENRQSPAEMP